MKPNYIKETFNSKEEWLVHRGLGGSSASAIMDCSPYMTKLDIFNAMKNPKVKEVKKADESCQYGVACEDLIRQQFALDFVNYEVHKPENYEMFRDKTYPYLTATLDGILTDKETKKKYILEIKTRDIQNNKELLEWESGTIPQNYYCQLIHYLMVMNDFDGAALVAKLRIFGYDNGKRSLKQTITKYYFIDRNERENDIKALKKAEIKFYEDCQKGIVPKIKIKF